MGCENQMIICVKLLFKLKCILCYKYMYKNAYRCSRIVVSILLENRSSFYFNFKNFSKPSFLQRMEEYKKLEIQRL